MYSLSIIIHKYILLAVHVIKSLSTGLFLLIFNHNFNYFFVKFHEAVFSNDYWIFDPDKDPVINILPQEVFFHIGILILAIILIISILLQISYRILNKRFR